MPSKQRDNASSKKGGSKDKDPKIKISKARENLSQQTKTAQAALSLLLEKILPIVGKSTAIDRIADAMHDVVEKTRTWNAARTHAVQVLKDIINEKRPAQTDEQGHHVVEREIILAENEEADRRAEREDSLKSFLRVCEDECDRDFGTGNTQSSQDGKNFVAFCMSIPRFVCGHQKVTEDIVKAYDIVREACKALDDWFVICDWDKVHAQKGKFDGHVQAWRETFIGDGSAEISKKDYDSVKGQLQKEEKTFKDMYKEIKRKEKSQKVERRLNEAMEDFRKLGQSGEKKAKK